MTITSKMPSKHALVLLISMLSAFLAATAHAQAQLFETRAEQALLYDVNTGTVMFAKNADQPIPPASLAKLMTMEVVFHAIKSGKLSLDDEFTVSENAWRTGGAPSRTATMFAALGSSIRLEDLIKGVIVQSANDGCIIIAEGMAGSEAAFTELMNQRAAEIGLTSSIFVNSTGLPAEGQVVTMRDLVTLANHIQRTYPSFYAYYSLEAFEWNRIFQRNRNPLLGMEIGADGFKTGFTEESGYAIVGSTLHNGRRILVAMSGMTSPRERANEARKILEWGQEAFAPYRMFGETGIVGSVTIYGGEQASVQVRPARPLEVMLPATNNAGDYRARIVYQSPIKAPVEEGQEIATLRLLLEDQVVFESPLAATAPVARGALHAEAWDAFVELTTGWISDLLR